MSEILHDKAQKTENSTQNAPQSDNPPIGTVTSSYFVAIDTVFQVSNVGSGSSAQKEGLTNAVQLLWFTSVEERVSQGNMTSDYQASATLVHSLLEMHIMTDSAMPMLREDLRNNTPIATITITRVGHLGKGKDNTTLYSTVFTNCFLESIEEFPDKLILKARVNTRSDTANVITYEAGWTAGKSASGWDYTQNTALS